VRGRHSLPRSFAFAWDGLAEGALRDRNLRIHLALGVLAGAFAAHAPLSPGERALLALCIALVVGAESMNSALEAVVDLASPGWDERARVAKDAAAAAVLAVAAGSVLAFLAVATPRLEALAASAAVLAPPAAGALLAAVAALALPAPFARPRAADVALALAGAAGLGLLAWRAEGKAGVAAAALCLGVSVAGAARRRARSSS
jgi:diacylglycerol kinase (ATP)